MLHRVGFIAAFILGLTALRAEATAIATAATGVSNFTLATTAGTTAVPFTIYGAKAGTCSTGNTTGVCNTCTGAAFRSKCSLAAVNSSTIIRVTFSYTATATTTLVGIVKVNGTANVQVDNSDLTAPTAAWVEFNWGNLCGAFTSGCNGTIQVGVGTDSSTFTDKVDVRVVSGDATSAPATYTICPAGTPGTANQGICNFQIQPGDGKVYVSNLGSPSTFPSTGGDSSNQYAKALFYYEPVDPNESETTAYNRISFARDPKEIAVGTGAGASLTDDRIDGLNNDQKYCFVLAMQDQVGNLMSFSPESTAGDPNFLVSNFCGTPEQVFGLLDDKHCFIATAAWGSDMDPHVERFRQFRNKYLLPYEWGRSFVQTYYKLSPPLAQFISENEAFRAGARVALWPILGFANLSLEWGLFPSLVLLIASFALVAFILLRPLSRRRIG